MQNVVDKARSAANGANVFDGGFLTLSTSAGNGRISAFNEGWR